MMSSPRAAAGSATRARARSGGERGCRAQCSTRRARTPRGALSHGGTRPEEPPLYDAALIGAVRERGEGAAVCVDAPLTLPPCVRCEVACCPGQSSCIDAEVVALRRLFGLGVGRKGKPAFTPYTQRATEAYLERRRGIAPREALGQGMGPLTARASFLVRALADRFTLNDSLVEVFPRATLELLGFRDPYKKRVDKPSFARTQATCAAVTIGPCRVKSRRFFQAPAGFGFRPKRQRQRPPSPRSEDVYSAVVPSSGVPWSTSAGPPSSWSPAENLEVDSVAPEPSRRAAPRSRRN